MPDCSSPDPVTPGGPPEDASLDDLIAGTRASALADAAAEEEQGEEHDRLWLWIQALRQHGGEAVQGAAGQWCRDESPAMRAVGASVLGQLSPSLESPEFARACIQCLLPLLDDSDAYVLESAILNLGHLYGQDRRWDIAVVARHASHEDWNVRHACCFALGGMPAEESPLALATLIQLMGDEMDEVRDWATFGAAANSEADSPELRAALVQRLGDASEIVRAEAICGLAKRHDPRAHPAILEVLGSHEALSPVFEAAQAMPSPDFIDSLQDYLLNDPDSVIVLDALEACEAEASGREIPTDRLD